MDKRPYLKKSFLKKKEKEVPSLKDTNYAVYAVYPFISKRLDFKTISIKAKYIKNTHFLVYSTPVLVYN